MGAALLLSGIVGAIASSPLFDRVLTHHLGITVRIFCPIVGVAWLSLIWAGKTSALLCTIYSHACCSVKPDNTGSLFFIFVLIGICSISLLPVAVELGVELTRNSDGSSAVLWFLCVPLRPKTSKKLIHFLFVFKSGNLVTIIFILGKYHFRLALP